MATLTRKVPAPFLGPLFRLAEMREAGMTATAPKPRNGDAWSDEALVEAIVQRGSQRHFAALVARYKDKVHRIALSVLGPARQAEAEDVTQEVFIRLFRRLESFRGDSRFSTWLYRLSFNTCIDHARREARHDTLALEQVAEPAYADDAAGSMERDRRAARVMRAVESLPRTQRMMIHMFYWLGFRVREIAEVMDCPEGTVKVYLRRARKQLAARLGDLLDER